MTTSDKTQPLPPIVIFAVGNPSRGDDALGPLLAEALNDWIRAENQAAQFEVIEDFQLNIEHALDLQGRKQAIFVDASVNTAEPFCLTEIYPAPTFAHTTHALPPEAVLQVYQQTLKTAPPPAFVLSIRGESFELGAEPSAAAQSHLAAALSFLKTHLLKAL